LIQIEFIPDKDNVRVAEIRDEDEVIVGVTSMTFREWKAKKDEVYTKYRVQHVSKKDLADLLIAHEIVMEEK
jgi:thymidylate synthase ThyX